MFLREAPACLKASTLRSGPSGMPDHPLLAFRASLGCSGLDCHTKENLMEYLFNRPPDVSFHLEYVRQLHESPTAITAESIHSGSPVRLHSSLLFLCVLAAVPFDLDNQM